MRGPSIRLARESARHLLPASGEKEGQYGTARPARFAHFGMLGLVPVIRVFAAFLACRLTPITLARNSRLSPFAEGRSRGELECERGAAPAVTIRNRDPGRPWRCLQPHYDGEGSILTPSRPGESPRDRDQREAGRQGSSNAAVERRKARPSPAGAGRLFFMREQASRVRFMALCSLSL
jgi:hypothetical protein